MFRRTPFLLLVVLSGCGTSQSAVHQGASPAGAVRANRAETLGWLRGESQKVRHLPPGQLYATPDWERHDVASLVGITHRDLVVALGQPDVCPHFEDELCFFGPSRLAYEFFRLAGTMGGGPNVVLQFDDHGVCTDARWIVTN